ncbi:protein-glutamate O-methyltransferase CheR [bacterium]|nr:protein-glutamate O-methyltransferase CheR [bacterium]
MNLPALQEYNLSEKEYKMFTDLIYQKSGISLGFNKQHLVKARLQKIMRELGINKFKDYYDYLTNSNGTNQLIQMIDAITTNHTFFFREKEHFSALNDFVIPHILSAKKTSGNRKIRAWCCASSTGEEPYTIVLCLMNQICDIENYNVKLLATDISSSVLMAAVKGIYCDKKVKSVPLYLLNKYFDKFQEDGAVFYKVKPVLKDMIIFRLFNLISPVFPFKNRFDFIFCRNVMIYFDIPTREELLLKLVNYLAPGGYLFIGHSENISGPAKEHLKMTAPAFFMKKG